MALGVLVFALATQLRPDFTAFFGDSSVLTWALLHFVLPIVSILLILGFCSRLCSLICWAGVVYIQQANPHILYGSDRLLHLLLFWAVFLPIGSAWSLDSWLFKKPYSLPLSGRWAVWAITLQICCVYWSAAISKTGPMWTQNHNALFYALNLEDTHTPFGSSLRQYPALLRLLTAGTLYLEYLGPLLLFVPYYQSRCRLIAVILFVSFHLICMQSMMMLGFFPWVCAAAWLIFIPAFFWDFVTGPFSLLRFMLPPKGWVLFLDRSMAGLVLISLADVLAWNAVQIIDLKIPNSPAVAWMKSHDPTVSILHLDQRWRLFAPNVYAEQGWLIVPAELTDGTQIDLYTHKPLSWDHPEDLAEYLGDDRWRAFMRNLFHDRDPGTLHHYSETLVDKWNAEHPATQQVKKVTLVFMKETTHADLTISKPEPVTLYEKNY